MGNPHPSLGRRTPARLEDFFDHDALAELRAYTRPRRRVRQVDSVVSTAVMLALIFLVDIGPEVAGWVASSPWPVRLAVVMGVFGTIASVMSLPLDYWADLVHDRRHGLSNQTAGEWALDQVKDFVLNSVLNAVVLVPVYWAVRTFDAWWLVGGLLFLGISIVLNFVYPVWIMPRFNKFTPMEPGPVRSRIEEIAAMTDTSIEGVYTMDGSKRSRRGNAFVAGFGPTKRVVVYDTMLDDDKGVAFPLEQLSQVVAHEIGHYRLNHIPKSFPFLGLSMLATLGIVQAIGTWDTLLGWAGVADLGDPAAAPLFLLAFGLATSVLAVAQAWLSRRNEREADLEALQVLRDPNSFVRMWPTMVELNKADLEPTFLERLKASHPGVEERMQFGLDWAALNGVSVQPPAAVRVPAASPDRS